MVKHEAAQSRGAGTVKCRAADLSAARDHEVTVAGCPDADEQLRVQTESQTDRHQNRGADGRREDHCAEAEANHAEDEELAISEK